MAFGGVDRIRTGVRGFADPCLTTRPPDHSLIIALLVLNVTMTFSLAVNLTRTKADLSHLSNQFKSLAHDFKEHRKEFVELKTELKTDVGNLKKDVNTLNNKLDTLTKKFDDYLSKRTLKSS